MIKLFVTAARHPTLSLVQFQRYWLDRHGPLVARLAPALRLHRYVQNHGVTIDAARVFHDRGFGFAVDGIAEGWWLSQADLAAGLTSADGAAAWAELAADEANFCSDLNHVFVAEEHVFVAGGRAIAGARLATADDQ